MKNKKNISKGATEQRLVPELRFPEFEANWIIIAIGELCNLKAGHFIKASEIFDEELKELFPCYGGNGLRGYTKEYNKEGKYTLIGRQGAHCGNVKLADGKFYATEHALVVSLLEKTDTDWFYYLLYRANLNQYATGQAQPGLAAGKLEKVKIKVSPTLPEQQKIAAFLTAVVKRIELLEKKKALLEQYKKGVMQKMFSQEIRFKKEDGSDFEDWEEKKIKEIFQVTRGQVLSADKTVKFKEGTLIYPVYSSQTRDNGLMGYYDQYLFENAVTWTTDGANAGDVNFRKGKFYCTNVCGVLLSEEGYANTFIAEKLKSITKRHVSYVGNPKLMNNVMSSIRITIPNSLKEQQQISDFIESLDDLISKVDNSINSTFLFKKGLLQKMFV